jgi:hypothetical protein
MKKIETQSGFKCTINETVLDDMRFLELVAGLDENPLTLPIFLEKFLGEKQKEKLYKHIETKDGRVPVSALQNELADIMAQAGEDETVKK